MQTQKNKQQYLEKLSNYKNLKKLNKEELFKVVLKRNPRYGYKFTMKVKEIPRELYLAIVNNVTDDYCGLIAPDKILMLLCLFIHQQRKKVEQTASLRKTDRELIHIYSKIKKMFPSKVYRLYHSGVLSRSTLYKTWISYLDARLTERIRRIMFKEVLTNNL